MGFLDQDKDPQQIFLEDLVPVLNTKKTYFSPFRRKKVCFEYFSIGINV